MIFYASTSSPLGDIHICCTEHALCSVGFTPPPLETLEVSMTVTPLHRQTFAFLKAYFQGDQGPCSLPLKPQLTGFQKLVLREVSSIPYGSTLSYGELAARLRAQGYKASAQAVGGALRRNPLLLIIPCHRVTGAHHQLLGYAGGLNRQSCLLELEKTQGRSEA